MIKLDKDPFNINEWTEKVIREVNETDDAFVFSTIKPFINSISTFEISKEELAMAISLIRKKKEAIEKFGEVISDDWSTAIQQSAALERAYRSGFQDGMKEYHERLERDRNNFVKECFGKEELI